MLWKLRDWAIRKEIQFLSHNTTLLKIIDRCKLKQLRLYKNTCLQVNDPWTQWNIFFPLGQTLMHGIGITTRLPWSRSFARTSSSSHIWCRQVQNWIMFEKPERTFWVRPRVSWVHMQTLNRLAVSKSKYSTMGMIWCTDSTIAEICSMSEHGSWSMMK